MKASTKGILMGGAAVLLGSCWLAALAPVSALDNRSDSLAGEARKYRTYEEFARAVTNGDPEKRLGMDTWYLWTAGNQEFWGREFRRFTRGEVDLLRLLDARALPRDRRFAVMGVINDPGCKAPEKPDEYGFLLDAPQERQTAEQKKLYGEPTGFIGLRRFPNPRFDRARWARSGGAKRYLAQTRENFDPELEPPYLIGVSCASCHVAFNPLNPPANPAEPAWENLASGIGNQYLAEERVFTDRVSREEFRWHVGKTQQPGTSDTSRITADFINNPTAINPVFGLPSRLRIRTAEEITPSQATFIKGMPEPIPADLIEGKPPRMLAPHGLIDGADSVGLALATMRVYCNIGGTDTGQFMQALPSRENQYTQTPFDIFAARAHPNGRWAATEKRLPALQRFLASIEPMPLSNAPGGEKYLQDPPEVVARGKFVFANHCASCHSSKHPDPAIADPEERRKAYERLVAAPNFLNENFLSDDRRYPITEIQTNAGRALATNAARGQIWEPFSSETYKQLPSAGRLWGLHNPMDPASPISFSLPAGGRGYYRTPTLIAMWATAPYLHNNSVGIFNRDPSVDGRMQSFYDGVQKLLWPEQRLGPASVKRTTVPSQLTDPFGEPVMVPLLEKGKPVPLRVNGQPVRGPNDQARVVMQPFTIPAGTPVNLFAHLHPRDVPKVLDAYSKGGPEAGVARALELNQCPDFVEDRGHTYGAELPDEDKWALIAFLKRL